MADNLLRLKNLLLKHDWFYDYSDDRTAWGRGLAEKQEILSLARGIDVEHVSELVELVPEPLRELWKVELRNLAIKPRDMM